MISKNPNEKMTAVVEMINDRSGLWLISDSRKSMIRESLEFISSRSVPAANEMLSIADNGHRFWTTKAEYYVVLNEIRNRAVSADRATVESAIEMITKGSKADKMDHREWVKKALDVLTRISKEK